MNIEIKFSNVNSADMAKLAEALKLLGQASEDNLPAVEEIKAEETQHKKASKVITPVEDLPYTEAKVDFKHTLEDLRELAIIKAKEGKSESVKNVISSHGIEKVSATPIDLIDKVYTELAAL